MKRLLKRLLPTSAIDRGHWLLGQAAAWRYGRPSEKLVVLGVTGTNGKTTTANLLARILEESGHRVGLATTANFKIAEQEWLNDTKMTMLGRSRLQSLLARMVAAGCTHAVIETSSEGVKQWRHAAINYDTVVFTNLTPEHLESHGGFDNYKRAKGKLFAHLMARPRKRLAGRRVEKTAVVNLGDEHAGYFLSFRADRKVGYFVAAEGARRHAAEAADRKTEAKDIRLLADRSEFTVAGEKFVLPLPGLFNVENALAAIAAAVEHGVTLPIAARALEKTGTVPGRMEFIDLGQPFRVLVDYAPEPESFRRMYEAVARMDKPGRIIHVLGSCGGGRDVARRPVLGRLAAEQADIVIVTNEDPYDDDPAAIIEDVAEGAEHAGKRRGHDLFTVLDRAAALEKAVALARPGDLVIATGKGAEQAICVGGGRKLPWDERAKLREIIARRLSKV